MHTYIYFTIVKVLSDVSAKTFISVQHGLNRQSDFILETVS